MSHFLSSFSVTIPDIESRIYDISAELSEEPYSQLGHFENILQEETGGQVHRIRGKDNQWYLTVFGQEHTPNNVEADGVTLSLEYQSTLNAETPRHRAPLANALRNGLGVYLKSELGYWEYNDDGNFYEPNSIQTVKGADARYEMYRGVRTSIDYRVGSGYMLSLDPTRKFLDEQTLADRLEVSETSKVISDFGSGRRFFFFDKPEPEPVRLHSVLDASVSEETMSIDGKEMSVMTFVENKYGSDFAGKIDPDEPVVKIKYSAEGRLYDAAPSLLRLIPYQEEATTQASTLPANERWSETKEWKRPINYISLGGYSADVAEEPIRDGIDIFDFPRLSFGQDIVLGVGSRDLIQSGDVTRSDWEYRVLDYLQEFGPKQKPMDEPWLAVLYSESTRETAFAALDDLREYLQRYADVELRKRPGGANFDNRNEFAKWKSEFGDQVTGALAYMAGDTGTQYYDVINAVDGKPVQHIRHENYQRERDRDESYSLRNTATDLASKLGVRPFLLEDGLHVDAVVGLSVTGDQQTTVCSVTVSGENGGIIDWTDEPHGRGTSTVTDHDLAERLVGDAIMKAIDHGGQQIESLVIHRNGKYGNEEIAGIRSAIDSLESDGYIDSEFSWSAVELLDNTSYRIYSDGADGTCETGAYARVNDSNILVAPSGRPFSHQGTPRTFQIKVKAGSGEHEIVDIGKDVFDLSFLAWWSPGSKLSNPITTRYPSKMHDLFEYCQRLRFLPS